MTSTPHTAADKLACIRREVAMRERVYPRWVAAGRMTQAKADAEIAIMREVAGDYERQAEGERLL